MKVGRNESCPCGSGKKYKRCCANQRRDALVQEKAQEQTRVTLGGAIAVCQEEARKKKVVVRQLGVFILYCDSLGDAWVLEVTDSDCIQIASEGKPLDVPLEENEETIMVDWSHTFAIKNKRLQISSYRDKQISILENAPVQQIFTKRRKILKKISPQLLQQVHIENEQSSKL